MMVQTADYTYRLPQELIAHEPVEPRDASRLLVYSTKTDEVIFDTFANLARYIPADSILVLNDTKVIPARLTVTKLTGGKITILFLFNEWDKKGAIKGLPDKKVTIGEGLFLGRRPLVEAISQNDQEFTFKLLVPPQEFEKALDAEGKTPLPPYIHSELDELAARERYQTVFASNRASVAAPTASLHFTDQVFQSLSLKGVGRTMVTLHVGRGTFSPVLPHQGPGQGLHPEPIDVCSESAQMISIAKKNGRRIVAAGTTSMRVLESAADSILAGTAYHGETSLFIRPPYGFKVVDALITNFHLPQTSLLMLVDALLQAKKAKRSWRDLYEIAIREKFHFYSFGDAMLIL